MGKQTLKTIMFDWMMAVDDRMKIEELLRTLGYSVDGGGTDPGTKSSYIRIRPRPRVRKPRKEAAAL